MSGRSREELEDEARAWLEGMQCPLPVDLAMNLNNAGGDASALERRILYGDKE